MYRHRKHCRDIKDELDIYEENKYLKDKLRIIELENAKSKFKAENEINKNAKDNIFVQ